jgi:hypothetical protein
LTPAVGAVFLDFLCLVGAPGYAVFEDMDSCHASSSCSLSFSLIGLGAPPDGRRRLGIRGPGGSSSQLQRPPLKIAHQYS